MPLITPESDKPREVPVGATVGGRDLVVTTNSMGYFIIEARGPGGVHPLTDQVFTSLLQAKRAVDNWRRANASLIAKEALKDRIVNSPTLKEQRRAAAMALKNGELSTPEEDEDAQS
jgi:hypothetical protein